MKVESHICRDDEQWPQLVILIDGDHYGFTLHQMDVSVHEWLEGVVSDQFQRAVDQAFRKGQESVRKPMLEAMGLKMTKIDHCAISSEIKDTLMQELKFRHRE